MTQSYYIMLDTIIFLDISHEEILLFPSGLNSVDVFETAFIKCRPSGSTDSSVVLDMLCWYGGEALSAEDDMLG